MRRADEKHVTERAAKVLNRDQRIRGYDLEVENFESIHKHSAWARISRDKDGRA